MTEPQVFVAAAAVLVVAVALVSVGVALVAGVGWALIAAGAQLAAVSVGGGYVLLRDGGSP